MKKLKDKKFMGIPAMALPILWGILNILVALVERFFKIGRSGDFGGVENLLICVLVIVVGAAIGAQTFLKDKLGEKVLYFAKKAVPVLLGVLAVNAVFDMLSSLNMPVEALLFGYYGLWEGIYGLLEIFAALSLVGIALIAYGNKTIGKFWYAPAALRVIYAVVSLILSVILIFVEDWDFSIFWIFAFVTDIVFALTLGAIGYWCSLPEKEEVESVQ